MPTTKPKRLMLEGAPYDLGVQLVTEVMYPVMDEVVQVMCQHQRRALLCGMLSAVAATMLRDQGLASTVQALLTTIEGITEIAAGAAHASTSTH